MSDQEILEKLRLGALSDEAKQQALQAVQEELEVRLAGIIDDLLSDKQRKEFEAQTAAAATPEKVFEWLSQNTTDLTQLYEAALADYIEEVNTQTDQITS